MEKQERSLKSSVIQSWMPRAVNSNKLPVMIVTLFAATSTLMRRPITFFRDSAIAEERPQTPFQRFLYTGRFLALLVPATLIAGLLWVIWTRTADVPYWDEWETVLLDQQFKQGTLSFHDIVALHATAHRIIIPRLIDLALVNLTNWNRQIEMTFDLTVAIASACLLFWCVRRTMGSLTATLALVAPLSLFFFSFSQFADWFAPFQLQFIVTVFGVACCVRGFAKTPVGRKGFALAIAGALIGSFSGLHGLVIWIAFLPGAIHAGVRKASTWVGCAAVVWFLYFQHFPHSPTRLNLRADIVYSLAYLGAPVSYPHVTLAQIAGLLSFLLLLGNILVYWIRHKNLWYIAPWLQLALFVLGCTQATAEGRIGGGPQQALLPRYEAFSALWWVALLVITGLNIKELLPELSFSREWKRAPKQGMTKLGIVGINLIALLLITASLIPVNLIGVHRALLWQDVQRQDQYAIVEYQSASNTCLEMYYPWPDLLRPRAQFLKQQRLAIFNQLDLSRGAPFNVTAPCQKPYYYYINDVGESDGGSVMARATSHP